MSAPAQKQVLLVPLVGILITFSTILVMLYAQGYRINFNRKDPQENLIKTTGLIAATSQPKSAAIYLDGKLASTTDATLTVDPGPHQIRVAKDGYLPWQKDYQSKAEVVFTTNATLFKSVPDLQPLTLSGAINPALSPDGSIIVYAVDSASQTSGNGLYLYETSQSLSLIKSNPKQITPNLPGFDWSKAIYVISPDNKELIAYFGTNTYLLDLSQNFTNKSIVDISTDSNLSKTKTNWNKLDQEILANKLRKLPKDLQSIVATDSAKSLVFNSDNDKVLYMVEKEIKLPENILPPMPAKSTQAQARDLKPGYFYVYDLVDDTNFVITSLSQTKNISWIPETSFLAYIQDNTVYVVDYDATNRQKIYAGQFKSNTLGFFPDGKKIILSLSPYPTAPENLYSITIR